MRWRRRLVSMALVCAGVLLLSACDGDDEPAAGPPVTAVDPTPTDEDGPAPNGGQDPDIGTAEPDDGQPPAALAVTTLPIDWVDGGELEAAVTGIEVAGELLRVAVTFTASLPPETEDVAIGAVLLGNEGQPGAGVRPELIDPVNLKAYEVVAGGTRGGASIRLVDGVARTLVFYYAAPQDDLDTIDFMWSSQVPPLTDVPFPG